MIIIHLLSDAFQKLAGSMMQHTTVFVAALSAFK
jgi:hypothetical protein